MKTFLLLLFLLLPQPILAAVAYDTTSSNKAETVTSLTWSHTITGANVTLVASSCLDLGTGPATAVTGFTYNSVTLTTAGGIQSSIGNTEVSARYAVAPATGAHNAVITLDTTGNVVGISTSYTGAHQTTPVSNVTTGQDSATGITVTVPTNGMTEDFICTADTTLTAGGGQTQRAQLANPGSSLMAASTRTSGTTFSWSGTLSSGYDSQIGLAINETAATTAARRRIMTSQ